MTLYWPPAPRQRNLVAEQDVRFGSHINKFVFVSCWLDYCKEVLYGSPAPAECCGMCLNKSLYDRPHFCCTGFLHWLPVQSRIEFVQNETPSYGLRSPKSSCLFALTIWPLCSQDAGRHGAPKSRKGTRAFSSQDPLLWNHRPVSVYKTFFYS